MREILTEVPGENDYYVIRTELLTGDDAMGEEPLKMTTCYTSDGHYIGMEDVAKLLCVKRGIKPELPTPEHKVCCIGFNVDEQKWYGWSHRAIYGFGIGSEVKRGDCGYVPVDLEDARDDAVRFWDGDEHHYDVTAIDSKDESGKFCFDVKWKYTEGVPNTKLRGTIGGVSHYPPDEYGRGEWQAKTLEDAKQMAIDFAEGVG